MWRRRRNGPVERRAQARRLLVASPVSRFVLAIGRPDLLRTHKDGGLVDINAVPDHVILRLFGMRRIVARRIVAERALRGPFTSMLDLTIRCALGSDVTAAFNERLLFLPPPPPPSVPRQQRAGASQVPESPTVAPPVPLPTPPSSPVPAEQAEQSLTG